MLKLIIMKKNEYDVAIFGGGPAGIACAYNAGKLGLKTVLIEKNNYLGGQITGALVVPMMKSSSDNINVDFFNALVEYSKNTMRRLRIWMVMMVGLIQLY